MDRRSPHLWILLIALLAIFQLGTAPGVPVSSGFAAIPWEKQEGCVESSDAPNGRELRMVLGGRRDRRVCSSEPFLLPHSDVVEIEFEVPDPQTEKLPIWVEARGTGVDLTISLPLDQPGGRTVSETIRTRSAFIPNQLRGQPIKVVVTEGKRTRPGEFRMRSRINFSERQPFYRFRSVASIWPFRALTSVFLAAVLLPIVFAAAPAISNRRLLCALIFLSSAIHFRSSAYFHWDEWHLMQSFYENGLSRIFQAHNEHVLPIAFSVFRAEMAMFGSNYGMYLLLSIFVHAINALLLIGLLQTLFSTLPHARAASVLAGVLYALNGLHAESVQWGMEICITLLQTFTLLALRATERYVRTPKPRLLAPIAAYSILAPLTFGNGLCLPALVGCFGWLVWRLRSSREDDVKVMNVVLAVILSTVGSAAAAALYVIHRVPSNVPPIPSTLGEKIEGMVTYALTASQLGTVLRGIALIPHYEPAVAQRLYPSAIASTLPQPWLWIILGFAVGIGLAILAIRVLGRRDGFAVAVSGQLLILVPMILPAIGRWELGPLQSLSIRYHVLPLTGLFLLLFPVALLLFERTARPTTPGRNALCQPLWSWPGIAVWFIAATNLFAGADFEYFVDHGVRDRIYIAQLREWRTRVPSGPYEGTGTDLAGLFPIFPPTMTPGRHPDEIYRTLTQLDERR
ncbi:MAG: hypothetical protein IT290_07970 [Deltaproteobacteria bacterium]|nr:hypothetical protein [Deltaproteobacteria bacterium]